MQNLPIDPRRWIEAEEEADYRVRQIQGFFYSNASGSSEEGVHVVRDCSLAPGDQMIWQRWTTEENYHPTHTEMLREIRIRQARIVAETYVRLADEAEAFAASTEAP